MPEWSEDFSQRTPDEIVGLQAENRAWQKELRTTALALVNSRLAKQISQEEYAVKREAAKSDADECGRRTNMLACAQRLMKSLRRVKTCIQTASEQGSVFGLRSIGADFSRD
jgi:hypothetical protein